MRYLFALLALVVWIGPAAAAPVARPAAMPAACSPVTTSWVDSGIKYEHPGSSYSYDVYISVNCPDNETFPLRNFRLIYNAGWGGHLSSAQHWANWGQFSQEFIGCSPGVSASPNDWQLICQQYTSWNVAENQYRITMINTPDTSNCGGYIGQSHKLYWNLGTVSSPNWQEIINKNRTVVWRYCS